MGWQTHQRAHLAGLKLKPSISEAVVRPRSAGDIIKSSLVLCTNVLWTNVAPTFPPWIWHKSLQSASSPQCFYLFLCSIYHTRCLSSHLSPIFFTVYSSSGRISSSITMPSGKEQKGECCAKERGRKFSGDYYSLHSTALLLHFYYVASTGWCLSL